MDAKQAFWSSGTSTSPTIRCSFLVGRFLLSLRYSTRASSQEEQASTQVEKEQASSRAKENKGFQPSSNEQRPPAKQPSIKKSLQGLTPLLQAAAAGQGNVVRLLVERRADPGVFDKSGRGILYLSYNCSEGRGTMYKWLRQRCWRGKPLQWGNPQQKKYRKNETASSQVPVHGFQPSQSLIPKCTGFQPNELIQIPKLT